MTTSATDHQHGASGSHGDERARAAADEGADPRERGAAREHADAEESHGLHVRSLHVRAVRKEAREVDAVASTEALDSYDEIVRANWDLKRFQANPVILWAHNRFEDRLPVGRAKDVRVDDGQLLMTVVFDAVTVFDEQVFQKYVNGTLRGFSVGFNPRTITVEKVDGEEVVVLDDNELFEVSCVPIPSNPEALARARTRAIEAAREAARFRTPTTTTRTHEGRPMVKEGKIKATGDTTCTVGCPNCNEDFEMSIEVMPMPPKKAAELAEERSLRQAAEVRVRALEEREAEVSARLVTVRQQLASNEIDALLGVKLFPAERETQLELAAVYLCQKDGEAKWTKHLDGIRARPDLKLLGASVVGKDPTAPAQASPPVQASPPATRESGGTSFAVRVAKAAQAT
jgi:HK97 family phage prohead protease